MLTLLNDKRFIFILDGFDEMPGEVYNLYKENHFNSAKAKVILTSRTQFYNKCPNADSWFKGGS